jgi:hypothetical protein
MIGTLKMSLHPCAECGQEISNKASACPKCGAKVAKTKWWIWIPLGLFLAFILFGMSIPKYKSEARQLRNACEELVKAGIGSLRECDQIYSEAIAKGASK